MGRTCSYPNCTVKAGDKIKLCQFPTKDPERRQKWLAACSLSPTLSQPHLYVCIQHFVEESGPTLLHPDPVSCNPLTPGALRDALLQICLIKTPNEEELSSTLETTAETTAENVSQHTTGTGGRKRPIEVIKIRTKADIISSLELVLGILALPDNDSSREQATLNLKNCVKFLRDNSEEKNTDISSPLKKRTRRALFLEDKEESYDPEPEHPYFPSVPPSPGDNSNEEDEQIAGEVNTGKTRSIGVQCERAIIAFYQCRRLPEKKFQFLTGVTQENFEVLYQLLGGDEVANFLKYYSYKAKTPQKAITSFLEPRDRMFMTLLRLRRGLPIVDLAYLFGISVGATSAICYTWTRFMSLQFQRFQKELFVTCEVQDTDPNPLFDKFPNLRVIVDTTEFKIQRPFHFQMQSNTYSEYKASNTLKFLLGISRSGAISFISKGYEGSCSDRQMIRECGFLSLLQEEDGVMADRGFDIEPELNKLSCTLYMPPFKGKRQHVTAGEELKSKAITSVRSYVEIANSRIRDFRLIRGVIPMKLLAVMDDLVLIACMLTNMGQVYVPNKNVTEEF